MRYISTRDASSVTSGAGAIAQGISKESGLFVPEHFPSMSVEAIGAMVDISYGERAYEVLKDYLPEFSQQELETALGAAYGSQFTHERIAPVVRLSPTEYMLELWHGPTCAFKDMALQLLPHLLTASLQKIAPNKKAVILVATSGDTGKAALEGFHDIEGIEMIVFYPEGGVSQVQELQMTTQIGDNVQVFAVVGNFDDTQTAVKKIFTDPTMAEKLAQKNMMFSSANSINWGRLAPQIVYYFSAYCAMVKSEEISLGDNINVCVPTGNFGNILAAYYAKQMGLPIAKFICASNENHVLTDFIQTGSYDANRDFILTNSPSMDILISSNLERLLFELSHRDDEAVAAYMEQLAKQGSYTLTQAAKEKLQQEFYGGYLTEEQTKQVIAEEFAASEYLCDTHTAVALGVYRQYQHETGDNTPTVIVSTANPYKFADSVLAAIDSRAKPADEFETLSMLFDRWGVEIPPQISELQHKTRRFTTTIEQKDMIQAVSQVLERERK